MHTYASTQPSFISSVSFLGGKLVENFLVLSSQLEQLKYEWWLKLLDTHVVGTNKEYRDMEDAYKDRVLLWARKSLTRKMNKEVNKKVDEVCLHVVYVYMFVRVCVCVCACY